MAEPAPASPGTSFIHAVAFIADVSIRVLASLSPGGMNDCYARPVAFIHSMLNRPVEKAWSMSLDAVVRKSQLRKGYDTADTGQTSAQRARLAG